MHIHTQRFQRAQEDGQIAFGVKCVLETTQAERDLMTKYRAIIWLGKENARIVNTMMAGGIQEWHRDVRVTNEIERGWFDAVNALAQYLSDAVAHRTDDPEGDDHQIGYISEEFGFMRGGLG